jgi:hypothetical protein
MRTAATLALLGLWMVGAPFIPMSVDGKFLTDLVVGVIVTNAGVMMASGEGWVRYLTTGTGLWIAISSFIPRMLASGMTKNGVIAGILLLVASVGALTYYLHHPEPLDPQTTL